MARTFICAALMTILFMAPARADQTDRQLGSLFSKLQQAKELSQAQVIENRIWKIWHVHDDPQVDRQMAVGIISMQQGALKKSLAAFDRVVEMAPDFAEGWNKRATVYYMMRRYSASVADIQRTLDLEPRHFGALSGLGLIFDAIGNGEAAVKVWERALNIHPNMLGIRTRMQELKRELTGPPT